MKMCRAVQTPSLILQIRVSDLTSFLKDKCIVLFSIQHALVWGQKSIGITFNNVGSNSSPLSVEAIVNFPMHYM